MMTTINIYAAWIAFLAGITAGAVSGMLFYNKEWLGGYTSWRRRMLRLAHISFFGLGLLNLAFAFTAKQQGMTNRLTLSSILLVVGLATMPLICYLSAWKPAFRHIFFIPVVSVFTGTTIFLWRLLFI